MMSASHVVYVLELEANQFYVGITADIDRRMREHFSGRGAEFTKRYQPIGIREVIEGFDSEEEAREEERIKTLELMSEKGICNVRGGPYTQSTALPVEIILDIRRQIDELEENCYKCHQPGHMANRCPGYRPYGKPGVCYQCGIQGHWKPECRGAGD